MTAGLKPYPAMKDSGVPWLGDVPEHWAIQRLGASVTGCFNGVWGGEPDGENDLACVRVADFDRQRLRVRLSAPTMRSIAPSERRRRMLEPGDLLLEKSGGGDLQPVGVVMLFDHESPATCSNFVARMPVATGYDSEFLVFLHSYLYAVRLNLRSIKQTTGIQNLDSTAYLSERVAYPPLDEQQAIARYLDHVDRRIRRYIAAKTKLIRLLEEQKQAIIHQAVTRGLDPTVPLKPSGVEWLGDIPAHWEVAALRHRYSQLLGKMLDSKRLTGANPVPYLRNVDVQWDRINTVDLPLMDVSPQEYDRYTVQPGDLLVCEGGEVGRCSIWAGELTTCGFQKALHRLRPRNPHCDLPRYLLYCLRAAATAKAFDDGHVSTIAHLTGDKLRAHRLPFPPTEDQRSIVRFLDATLIEAERAIAIVRQEIALLREYRTSLIADVVSGKLDVREAAARLPDEPEDLDTLDDATEYLTDDDELDTTEDEA